MPPVDIAIVDICYWEWICVAVVSAHKWDDIRFAYPEATITERELNRVSTYKNYIK